jgi:hypothetical protein
VFHDNWHDGIYSFAENAFKRLGQDLPGGVIRKLPVMFVSIERSARVNNVCI